MSSWWNRSKTFWREYRANIKHVGAVLPSGNALGRALCRQLRDRPRTSNGPLRVLEVGPGTGAVTRHLVEALGPRDSLDLCELNAAFVEVLRRRLVAERPFADAAERVRIFHRPVERLDADAKYDCIVSGLPLNNFQVAEVEHLLGFLPTLLTPEGTLSFFQYIGIRKVRAAVGGPADRELLRGIGRAMDDLLQRGEFRRDHVWVNVPPAYVHHVRLGGVRV